MSVYEKSVTTNQGIMVQQVAEMTAAQQGKEQIGFGEMRARVEIMEKEAEGRGENVQRNITATHKYTGWKALTNASNLGEAFGAITGKPLIRKKRHNRIADLQGDYKDVVDADVVVANDNAGAIEEVGRVSVHEERQRMRTVTNVAEKSLSLLSRFTEGLRSVFGKAAESVKGAYKNYKTARAESKLPTDQFYAASGLKAANENTPEVGSKAQNDEAPLVEVSSNTAPALVFNAGAVSADEDPQPVPAAA